MQNLQEIFANVNGSSFVGIDTLTTPVLKGGKSNPQQGRVTKQMVGAQIMVFQNKNINGYDAMVKRRLEAEGKDPNSFKLQPRKWGERVPNSPVVTHTNKKGEYNEYLEVIFLKPGEVTYFVDGVLTPKEDIVGLPESTEGGQGGLDNLVQIRSFKDESITAVRIDGTEYK